MKNDRRKNKPNFKVGDRVWSADPHTVYIVVSMDAKDARIRDARGEMQWVPLKKLRKADDRLL